MEVEGLTREQGQTEVASREGGTEVVVHVIDHAGHTLANFALLIDPIRKVARQLGYAIALHGSLAKDIDLIAVPWTDEAVEADVLVVAIVHLVKAFTGETWGHVDKGCPRDKPHGRRSWSIHFWGSFIDLSVTPRSAQPRVNSSEDE